DERPTYVLFNGAEGSLTGDKALKTKVGDTVRLFVGNGGPNLVSSFHVIGEIFDKVWFEGGTRYQENVQTTLIPAGGAMIGDFHMEVPGTFILVDHSIFRAFNKGAIGMIKAEGPEDKAIYSGKQQDEIYEPGERTLIAARTEGAPADRSEAAPALPRTRADRIAAGRRIFESNCVACHQATGLG